MDLARQAVAFLGHSQGARLLVESLMLQRHGEQAGEGLGREHIRRTVAARCPAEEDEPAQHARQRVDGHDQRRPARFEQEPVARVLDCSHGQVVDDHRLVGEQGGAKREAGRRPGLADLDGRLCGRADVAQGHGQPSVCMAIGFRLVQQDDQCIVRRHVPG